MGLEDFAIKLKMQGQMAFVDGVTKDQIAAFEKENSVVLPDTYKEWLLFSDGGEFFLPAGAQLYGVNHKPLIDTNDDRRPSDNYVVIGSLSSGDSILYEKGSERIFIYDHESGAIADGESYDDFIDFVADMQNLFEIR